MSKPRQESGFALLLVFLMSALIAISLYSELPRAAFESQRAKEQLLIERGEQYKRAIQLFVRKFNRYPGKIEELENTNSIRFLRRRYIDPMTGKDEWRLIRCGPGGVLLDSVNTKKDKDKKETNSNTFIAEGPSIGAVIQQGGGQANAAQRRRPSDTRTTPPGSAPGIPGQPPDMAGIAPVPGQLPGQPGYPGAVPAQPGDPTSSSQPGAPGQPGQPGMPQPYVPGVAGQTPQGGMPGQTGVMIQPGTPGYPAGQNFPAPKQPYPAGQSGGSSFIGGGSFLGGGSASPQPGVPGIPGVPGAPNPQGGNPYGGMGMGQSYPQPGTQPNQNEAVRMIQSILTSPRPQGAPAASAGGMGGQNIGGGIAGVASTLEQDSIAIYEEHQKYNEWEFIYDMSKDRTGAGMSRGGGPPGTPANQMNSQQNSFGTQPNSFGTQPNTFGTQPNTFGSQPGRRDD